MLKTYTQAKLRDILAEHSKWLAGKGGAGADLAGASLEGASLEGANLARANLAGAMRGVYTLKRPPLQFLGAEYSVLVFDEHVEIGCRSWSFAEFKSLKEWRGIDPKRFKAGKLLIQALIAEKLSQA